MATYAYVRVSTQAQADSGLGLDAQRDHVSRAASRLGLTIANTFMDAGVSGAAQLEQRPGLMAAIDALRRGDVLIVAKRDRLGRDTLLVAMVERLVQRKGARIVSAAGEGTDGDSPADILLRQMLDAFSQFERALIRARTSSALQARKRRGMVTTKDAPFGFTEDAGRRLIPCPREQATVSRMRALRASGLTLSAVADRLNVEGYRTRTNTPWRLQYVARVLAGAVTSTSEDVKAASSNAA